MFLYKLHETTKKNMAKQHLLNEPYFRTLGPCMWKSVSDMIYPLHQSIHLTLYPLPLPTLYHLSWLSLSLSLNLIDEIVKQGKCPLLCLFIVPS